MKVISSWPDYGRNVIVAVTEAGETFMLPILPDAFGTEWLPVTRTVARKTPLQRFDDSIVRFIEVSGKEPKILLLGPQDIDRMEKLMRDGVRFLETRKEPGWHMRFNGIELGGWLGVEDGTVVVCDEKFKVLGSFAWMSK